MFGFEKFVEDMRLIEKNDIIVIFMKVSFYILVVEEW